MRPCRAHQKRADAAWHPPFLTGLALTLEQDLVSLIPQRQDGGHWNEAITPPKLKTMPPSGLSFMALVPGKPTEMPAS